MKRAVAVAALLAFLPAGSASAAAIRRADRLGIDRTLDAFVNSAVKRENVDASWNLVTPELRAGTSRAAWDEGNLPVYPYPAVGTTFHDWTADHASPNEVEFELMLGSARSRSDSIQYTGTMKRIDGRWLVDSFNPEATFGAGGTVVGAHDFMPSSGGEGGKGVARLGSVWIAVPAAFIGAGILFLLGWFLFAWVRIWRGRRAYRRPLEPIVVRRRESEPALEAEERSEADGQRHHRGHDRPPSGGGLKAGKVHVHAEDAGDQR